METARISVLNKNEKVVTSALRNVYFAQHIQRTCARTELFVFKSDSGYPCRPFLLTPCPNPNSDREENYNISHIKTRNIIERVFGILKRKFQVMHSEVRMRPDKVSKVIIACAVLHNLSILWNEPDQLEILDDDQPQSVPFLGHQDGRGVIHLFH